ncbi:MAG: elongation factor G [Chloroherpetonaceae bacterium]|nr:elongation factor G [Chloroherpetonaceae bacterium]
MALILSENLRNVVLAGHASTGKTMLTEAFALSSGLIQTLGSIEQGTTLSDHAPDEIIRKHSINSDLINFTWKNYKINLIDTPGFADFRGDVKSAMRVADTVIITVSASTGPEVGTDTAFDDASEFYKPTSFVITKLDADRAGFNEAIDSLIERYGRAVVPIQFPIEAGLQHHILVDVLQMKQYEFTPDKPGTMKVVDIDDEYREAAKAAHAKLVEAVAETDETLMNKFFENGGELSEEDLREGVKHALLTRTLFPVFCASPLHLLGVERLLDLMVSIFPSPIERGAEHAIEISSSNEVLLEPKSECDTVAFVFKTVSEPHVGELSFVRVYAGHIESGHELINAQTKQPEKLGTVYTVVGKDKIPAQKLFAGDFGVVLKMKDSHTNNTLADKGVNLVIKPVQFPEPVTDIAVKPVARGDEEKISTALFHLHEEDPSFKIHRDEETAQLILSGLGDIHLETIIRRLKEKFGISVITEAPRVAYRETVRLSASAQGKFKRQNGGHGQYGDTWIRVEPLPRGTGNQFTSEVVGGVVPTRFIPAVEKGAEETFKQGILAGFPIMDMKVVVYDGSHHPVDSSEMAFKVAAQMGIKAAFEKAHPVLLEPIYKVETFVPDEYTGEVIAELSSRRGKIVGFDSDDSGETSITVARHIQTLQALVPLSELYGYQSALNRIAQRRATFKRVFSNYEEVPFELAVKVVELNKKNHQE